MILGSVADWDTEVRASWRRSIKGEEHMITWAEEQLPKNVIWWSATIEESDLPSIYVIGSDREKIFHTYRLVDIASQQFEVSDDGNKLRSQIIEYGNMYKAGHRFERIIMISPSTDSPFVLLDGNHRAAAAQRHGMLAGQEIYMGLGEEIGSKFGSYRQAVNHH